MHRADEWLYNTEKVSIIRRATQDIGFIIKDTSGKDDKTFLSNGKLYGNLKHPIFYNMAARVCKEQNEEVPTMIGQATRLHHKRGKSFFVNVIQQGGKKSGGR